MPCFAALRGFSAGGHDTRKIDGFGLDGDWIGGHGIPLDIGDVLIHAIRQRENQRDADDADRTGKGSQQRSGLFRPQIVETQ